MVIACPTCGNQNPAGVRSCQYCGAGLPASAPEGRRETAAARSPDRGGAYTSPADPAPYARQTYGGQYGAPTAPAYAPARVGAKDPNSGLLIELLPGFFGFLGIGWLWAGETALGVALLVGYWCFWGIVAFLTLVTFGFLLCLLPIFGLLYIAAPIISAFALQKRLRERGALVAAGRPF